MSTWKIENAKNSLGELQEIFISEGLVVQELPTGSKPTVINAEGLHILPGFVDLHTHLREPGREDAETVLTGSQAAVAGGFTAISAMNQSEARVRIFSDDGHCVSDPLVMRRALEYVKTFDGLIAQHAQDPRLTENSQMNEGEISARLGLKGWPAVAEEAIIARDVLLAEHVDSRLHICHLTTAGGVEIVRRAKERGIKVTAEVTPHHLLLTDEKAESYDPVFKVNPPLRTNSDVIALREGLADGTIDIIATDHAPHPNEAKDCEWSAAAFGMVGLETAFSIAYLTMVQSGLMTLADLANRMSSAPARIGRYAGHGEIKVNSPANLVLVDLAATWHVEREHLHSKSKNTPFHGMELPGVIKKTFHNGALVYESLDSRGGVKK